MLIITRDTVGSQSNANFTSAVLGMTTSTLQVKYTEILNLETYIMRGEANRRRKPIEKTTYFYHIVPI